MNFVANTAELYPEGQQCGLSWRPRVIIYHQTHHDRAGNAISLLPLLEGDGAPHVTHVVLAALHIGDGLNKLNLNDEPPTHGRYDLLWKEVGLLRAAGVKVLAMLGGAAPGSFSRLDWYEDGIFQHYYAPLRDFIRQYELDGLDIDVEEPMSLFGVVRLIDQLRKDFGRNFLITLTPVAEAMLHPYYNLSGFDYSELEVLRENDIDWYNIQFYCGWGDLGNLTMFSAMVKKGWSPDKLVIGTLTDPENGEGWVPLNVVEEMLLRLQRRHQVLGGVMGWEYSNGHVNDRNRPWEWAKAVRSFLGTQSTL